MPCLQVDGGARDILYDAYWNTPIDLLSSSILPLYYQGRRHERLFHVFTTRILIEWADYTINKVPKMSYSRPRFVPRTYHRNYLIGSSLYTDAIIDLNVRRGRPMYYSSSTLPTSPYTYSDRFNASRRGIRLHDDVYQKTTSRLATRDKLRHHEDIHKAFTGWHSPSYMPLYSIQGYDPARVPFQRRMYLIEPIQLHSQHAAHGRFMENRRLRFMHELWEQERDEERRSRIRSFYNKSGAPPQIPHHRLFSRPPAVYQLFY